MAAQIVSELANWDGRLDQSRQSGTNWRRSSSSFTRDPYHAPLENQSFGIFQPPDRSPDQKHAGQSASRSNLERGTPGNSPENARLHDCVHATLCPSHDVHHPPHLSISYTVPNTALPPSPFMTSSKSSHLTPNSLVHASRAHNSGPSSSREPIASLQHVSTIKSEVIDLAVNEDTEDELSVSDMLVPNSIHFNDQYADPGPSRRTPSLGRSSPIAPERSLFTPSPLPRKRTRLCMNYIAVPAFPKGLTKADYQPMSGHSVIPLPGSAFTNALDRSPLAESSVQKECSPSVRRWKGKEREHDVVASPKTYKRQADVNRADVAPNTSLDTFYEHTMIPLHDDDTYPPLTTLDLATNSRFQFAHAWRGHASKLREAELDWILKFRLLGKACIWVRSADTSSPRIPGTAGYVSSELLRPWQLVLPDSSPQEQSSKDTMDEQADARESHSIVGTDANYLSLPGDALPMPSAALDMAPSDLTLSQSFLSTAADMEHDMNQYFNGLSNSPNKHVPRQQPPLTYTLRSHLLQSTGHAQMSFLESELPSLELDSRLADTGNHECFLGVPPSPTIAGMESPIAPELPPSSPLESVNYFAASPSAFASETLPPDAWLFEQGKRHLPSNNNHVLPTALGTIDPSLLGLEQPQSPSHAPKDTSPERRSKLPEPVIYIRRPINASTPPLVSGKRPVQIKYRGPGDLPATPSTQSVPKEGPLNSVQHPVELSTNDTVNLPRVKRRSAPSRKLREYHHTASESDSDFIPETSKSKSKSKLKLQRPSVGNKEPVAGYQDTNVEIVPSSCHQCRNSSKRPKMLCSNMIDSRVCGKRFCNRCILYRYPDITFDQHSAGFLCPVCTNTCNCSVCSRNRGEEFVSMRLGGLAASIFKAKVTLVRDVGQSLHFKPSREDVDIRRGTSKAMTPTPEPGALPVQSQFWAHVYGMEGDRMGKAFMTREHMERLQTRVPSPPPSLSSVMPQRPKKVEKLRRREEKQGSRGLRVFIGRPLSSWKVHAVRDLEPSVEVETMRGKVRGKESTAEYHAALAVGPSRRRRCYIGNPAPLREPYGRIPGTLRPTPPSSRSSTPELHSDRSLTPLSELDAGNWPQPEVGECCSWAPQPPIGTVVHGLAGPFAKELPGPEVPGTTGLGTDVGRQDLSSGSGSGSGVEMNKDVDLGTVVAANGNKRTVLSEEDVARAISAALAALGLSVQQPP